MNQLGIELAVDLVAEVIDINVNDVSKSIEGLFPDFFREYFPGKYLVRVAHKKLEQGKLFARQLYFNAGPVYAPIDQV
jgi:hypothetical protein